MKRTRTTKRTVRFKTEEFDRLVEPLGYRGMRSKAAFIGCSHNTYWRMANGFSAPSAEFMASVRAALPQVPVETLFDFGAVRDRAA